MIMPRAAGEMYEWWRNSSRACTFEICSSITVALAPLIASCSATDVCVYAPGLKTTPIMLPAAISRPASWIQSISWPSWFDWRQSALTPSFSASSRHKRSTSASVSAPYTAGSRVPSRLRFGPFNTSTFFMASSVFDLRQRAQDFRRRRLEAEEFEIGRNHFVQHVRSDLHRAPLVHRHAEERGELLLHH